ncbi:MAG: gamma-glutamyl-gamma-aminobutyrate hydrolase family protein [Bacteroidota bacterium]|jgi:putative glutamine amidotransferase
MVIGVTDNMGSEHKFQQYIDWLRRGNASIRWTILSYKDDNLQELRNCNGLLLTGGGDVDPSLYSIDPRHPKLGRVDRQRDDFERATIDCALESQIPVLGICRGLQVANVHFGGSLIQDLGEMGFTIHQGRDEVEQRHKVSIEHDSLLAQISGIHEGDVNSFHHQAAAEPGNDLRVVARSEDGIAEALEFQDSSSRPFFLLIQWHPERMNDFHNPLTQNILRRFLAAVESISITYTEKES